MATTMNALNINTQTISGINYPDIQSGTNTTVTRINGTITISASGGGGGGGGDLLSSNNLSDVSSSITSRNNLFKNSVTTVNSTIILTETDFGSEVYIESVGGYIITLPAPSSVTNGFIDFIFNSAYGTPYASSNNYVVLNTPSGTINDISISLTFGAGDSLRLVSDGTNYWTTNVFFKPVDFLTTIVGSHALPGGSTITDAPYNNVIRNIGNGYDTISSRFFPPVPGLYEFYHYTSVGPSAAGLQDGILTVQMVNNFASAIVLTQGMAIGGVTTITPSSTFFVTSKVNTYINSNSSNSYGVQASSSSPVAIDFNTNESYFGGRRLAFL